eukprot:scaffold106122_cov17-Tisochrysis_lutea.AAC.2
MLIPIKGYRDSVKEWALIELQGKIEDVAGAELSNELGRLVAVQGQKDVVRLTVGYHQLEGKRLDLKKPFAILQKQQSVEEAGSATSYQCTECTHLAAFKLLAVSTLMAPKRGKLRQLLPVVRGGQEKGSLQAAIPYRIYISQRCVFEGCGALKRQRGVNSWEWQLQGAGLH